MKKRILGMLLCLSMVVGMFAGCGTKEVNVTNDKVENVEVTKKLEEQYIERIEAYQEYFDEIRDKYSEYVFGATITLDSEGLPFMWLVLGNSESWDDVCTTQLIGYENKKAIVLAEKGEAIVPYRGQLIMAQGVVDGEDPVYLYAEEKMGFVSVTGELKPSDDVDTIYSKDELNEKAEALSQMLECTNFFETIQIAMNDATHQVVYLGKSKPDFYYQALVNLYALLPLMRRPYPDAEYVDILGVALRKEYAENRNVLNYFEQLADAELDETQKDEILSDEESASYIYNNIIKAVPSDTYMLPNGTICTYEEAQDYRNKISIFMEDDDWSFGGGEAGEYFGELDAERILRELQKKPIYSQEELFLYLVSVAYNCEIVDVDLNDYILANASDEYISRVAGSYIRDSNSYESFFTDELIDAQSSLSETEPYKTIKDQGIDESSFEDNVATLLCYNGNEYQFQIEFNEKGDRISKIEYIDPAASMGDEEKLAYVIESEVLPAYENYINDEFSGSNEYSVYNLIYIDNDNVPELLYDNTADGRGTVVLSYQNGEVYSSSAVCRGFDFSYIPSGNKVVYGNFYKGDASYHVAHLENGMLSDEHGCVTSQEAGTYQIDGTQCSEEEYNYFLETYFQYDGMLYGWQTYSTIQEAYENMGKLTYHDAMDCYTEFSLNGNRLTAKTYDGGISLDMEVSEDCVWQTRYSDGSVYDSSYNELHESWEGIPHGEGMKYDSAEGLGIEVKNGKVVAVYMTAS